MGDGERLTPIRKMDEVPSLKCKFHKGLASRPSRSEALVSSGERRSPPGDQIAVGRAHSPQRAVEAQPVANAATESPPRVRNVRRSNRCPRREVGGARGGTAPPGRRMAIGVPGIEEEERRGARRLHRGERPALAERGGEPAPAFSDARGGSAPESVVRAELAQDVAQPQGPLPGRFGGRGDPPLLRPAPRGCAATEGLTPQVKLVDRRGHASLSVKDELH